MDFGFQSLSGLLALLLLIPLILIYLRRPKRIRKALPSVMFLSEYRRTSRQTSFLRRLLSNWLFFIHLLLLGLLSLAFAHPYVAFDDALLFEDVILVIDNSASTTADSNAPFEQIMREARDMRAMSTTIITTASPIRVHGERLRYDQASSTLASLRAEHAPADMESALLLALAAAEREPASIIVITDGRTQIPRSVIDAIRQHDHKIHIEIVDTPDYENIAIIDAQPGPRHVTLTLRNFKNREVNVTVHSEIEQRALSIQPNAIREITMPARPGENTYTINPTGDFQFDSTYYLANTVRQSLDALIVTTSEDTLPVERALRAANQTEIHIERNRLGTISRSYDLIVLADYAPELILPSFYTEVRSLVETGSILVVGAESNMDRLADEILPVTFNASSSGTRQVRSVGDHTLTRGLDYTPARNPPAAQPKDGTIPLAQTDEEVILAARPVGSGMIIYYGYNDELDAFIGTPSYPIFYSNIIDTLTGADAFHTFQLTTGRTLRLPRTERVQTPDDMMRQTDTVRLSTSGFYQIGDQTYAANSIFPEESDPRIVEHGLETEAHRAGIGEVTLLLIPLLALLALLLVFTETYYLKRRGDL